MSKLWQATLQVFYSKDLIFKMVSVRYISFFSFLFLSIGLTVYIFVYFTIHYVVILWHIKDQIFYVLHFREV
jgi:hypothetical protein